MSASMLLDLSERELHQRGLWPDPADSYADVNLIDGSDEMTITAVYKGLLDDSAESRQQIERLLFRRMNFIYHGGLIARLPDAAKNGRDLVVLLLLPDEEIPPTTLEMLQEYHSMISRRSFTLRVIQIPRDVL